MNSQTYESGRLMLGLHGTSTRSVAGQNRPMLSQRLTSRLTRTGDVAATVGATGLSLVVAELTPLDLAVGSHALIGLIAVLTSAIATKQLGAYRTEATSPLEISVLRVLGFGLGAATAAVCTLLLPIRPENPVVWPLCWLLSSTMLALVFQSVGDRLYPRLLASGRFGRRVVIVGANQYAATFIQRLRHSDEFVQVVGVFDDGGDGRPHRDVPVAGRVEDLLHHAGLGRVDAVILAIPFHDTDRIERVRTTLQAFAADILLMAGPAALQFEAEDIHGIGASPVVNICPTPLNRWQALQKSVFDRAIAAVLLLFLAPVLLGIALAIKCTSTGPVLFSQPRLGFNNQMFRIFKFRTMYAADTDLLADRQTTRGDPRITRLGAILRRLSLDELPQLLNVLNGSMSLVGPRPHAPNTKAGNVLFHDAVPNYRLRHRVKPGITGWAQVNGWRGETRSVEQIRQRVAFDLHYIENWSLPFDLRIIFLTVWREIFSSTAF